jgi:hypothetical protein
LACDLAMHPGDFFVVPEVTQAWKTVKRKA